MLDELADGTCSNLQVLKRIDEKEGGTSRVYAQGAGKTNALELAVLGKAKKFIKCDACQRVITAIYDGRITYSSSSFLDLLPGRPFSNFNSASELD